MHCCISHQRVLVRDTAAPHGILVARESLKQDVSFGTVCQPGWIRLASVQGYLAHNKTPTPLGPP